MEKELVIKWVEELESGKYEQCKGQLMTNPAHDEKAFCCLGVLCEIQKDKLYGEWVAGCGAWHLMSEGGGVYVAAWGIDVPNGPPQPFARVVSDMNDEGKTFKEIAQRIREEYLEEE